MLFRRFLTDRLVGEAREQADRGLIGSMEGHAEMDMSVVGGSLRDRLFSARGLTATSHTATAGKAARSTIAFVTAWS